ncbi:unnamed protein product [Ceutorhynchus assimilis]|uniref:Transmembrane protein n=1 Tax=Ceutorhynchus assimilis TaxID=467358 RepID=A0A9N9MCX8_9CUCU|nr:unnamed protein product [Ceutorhynchus assimilis]
MSKDQFLSCGVCRQICSSGCQSCNSLVDKQCIKSQNQKIPFSKIKKKKKILSTLDCLISVFIVTPLVVACWRGTSQLMDVYGEYFPPLESFIIGTLTYIVIGISQESFHGLINRKHKSWTGTICAFFCMKMYTIVLNAVTNMHWRGGWTIVEEYFGIHESETQGYVVNNGRGAFCFFTICFLLMFSMRCLRNLNSPPFEICLDYGDDMFLFPNMFKVKVSEKISLYIFDVVFSIAVVGNLGMTVWQGIWLLIDLYFFPSNEVFSAWGGLFLGYVIIAIVFLLQPFMKKCCDNLNGIPRLLVADSYMMFSVLGVILVWRGIWNLLNIYFITENEELSYWISLWVPMLILIIMGCSNSVLVRGVCLDCEEPDGSCVLFPCNYLKTIFDQEKSDTWHSLWTGVATNKLEISDINKSANTKSLSYHSVQIIENSDDLKNNNVERIGIS